MIFLVPEKNKLSSFLFNNFLEMVSNKTTSRGTLMPSLNTCSIKHLIFQALLFS